MLVRTIRISFIELQWKSSVGGAALGCQLSLLHCTDRNFASASLLPNCLRRLRLLRCGTFIQRGCLSGTVCFMLAYCALLLLQKSHFSYGDLKSVLVSIYSSKLFRYLILPFLAYGCAVLTNYILLSKLAKSNLLYFIFQSLQIKFLSLTQQPIIWWNFEIDEASWRLELMLS